MATTRYVALLRGINVGGRNAVPMADLRATVEEAGYGDVSTYIQSGNVLFSSDRPRGELQPHLESVLEDRFGIPMVVVVRSHRQLKSVVTKAPAGFGEEPDTYHSDVMFLRAPLTAAQVMAVIEAGALREGVDQAWPGSGVVYFSRLSAQRTRSKMSKILESPVYKQLTIRSWSTTTKLLRLLDESG